MNEKEPVIIIDETDETAAQAELIELTPDELEEEERQRRLAEARQEGRPRTFFTRWMRSHGRPVVNTIMIVALFGIMLGWLLHNAGITVFSMAVILAGGIVTYTML